jgi:DNA-binding response OmpR family regulator/Tfp pilus assembly protein PilZ
LYREQRIVIRCMVEFERQGFRVEAETEDLSVRGAFVRTESLMPVGAVVTLTVILPDEPTIVVVARVAHTLDPAAAAVVSRRAGMGLEFLEHTTSEGRDRLVQVIARLVDLGPEPVAMPGQAFAIVADPSAPLLSRLENALGAVGFESLLFRTAGDALRACNEFTPDIVVAALNLPDFDGVGLLARIKAKPALAEVPVVLLAHPADDFARLQAYRMGVRDVISQPFTDEELCIRVRRAAIEARRAPAEPMLRGSLGEISLQTLLSLFEFERKSGTLLVFAADAAARLSIAAGRVVRVEGPRSGRDGDSEDGSVGRLMQVLDWTQGRFEFSAGEIVAGNDEVGLGTSELIIEHARLRDELSSGNPS